MPGLQGEGLLGGCGSIGALGQLSSSSWSLIGSRCSGGAWSGVSKTNNAKTICFAMAAEGYLSLLQGPADDVDDGGLCGEIGGEVRGLHQGWRFCCHCFAWACLMAAGGADADWLCVLPTAGRFGQLGLKALVQSTSRVEK